jgi:anion-transporting  ArsA/GET3 family ATPase
VNARTRDGDLTTARLHVVTGKGGTGKTTLAAALALHLADQGGNVLLMEVEGRQGIAEVFDCEPLPYEERLISDLGPSGGRVHALAVDAEQALLEYLEMFYGIRRAGHALTRFGVVDFATTVAPGMRDVLLTGKAVEAVRRRKHPRRRSRWLGEDESPAAQHEDFAYDAVVLDGPPTGRIAQFLNVNAEVAGLAKVGPIRNHADRVMRVIRSAETAVHFVSTLEEMPVQECIDGISEIRAADIPVGGVLLNMTRDPLVPRVELTALAAGEVDLEDLTRGLEAAGIGDPWRAAKSLAAELTGHARRLEVENELRRRISTLHLPTVNLPLLVDGVDAEAVVTLSTMLAAEGGR